MPVVAPKDLAFVDKTVREASLRRMVAAPAVSAAPADDEAESAAASADPAALGDQTGPTPHELLQSVKRRRLYRRATGEEVVWFPHDNHTALLKELVWEAGGNHVKWVFYGTPAAGNGVLGVLEMGCSAICLCEDAHHKEHFLKALEQKAVEQFLLGSSNVFGDADLLAKAQKYIPLLYPRRRPRRTTRTRRRRARTRRRARRRRAAKRSSSQRTTRPARTSSIRKRSINRRS